jgi:TPR repeat protein
MIQTEGYSAEGLDLYRKAAEQGDVNAQIRLASVYYFGARGLSRDFTEAAKWYLLAANQGNTNAENAMGVMNENGFGMPVDGKAAMEWYRKAAEQGDVKGESNYGRGFAHSLGISAPNPSMAYLWLSISADRGEVTAKNFLVEYVNEMKPEELAEGKRLLAQYKASHGGGQTAQTTLDAQKIQTVQPIQSPEGAQGAQTTTSIGH